MTKICIYECVLTMSGEPMFQPFFVSVPDMSKYEFDSGSEAASPLGEITPADLKLLDEYDPVEESRRLEREGSKRSSSPPVVTEGPGASSKSTSSDTATTVPLSRIVSMEVDKSSSDVPMVTAPPSTVQSDASPPEPVEATGFGPHVTEALNGFLKTLGKHAAHRKMSIPKAWPPSLKAKKAAEVRRALDDDINKLIDACFRDRNIRFRETESFQSGGVSVLPPCQESEQSTTSSPEASKCACTAIHASIHQAISTCPVGRGHRDLCEGLLKRPNQPKRKLSYTDPPKTRTKPSTGRHDSPVPSTSGTQQGRRDKRDQGRGYGQKRRNHSSNRSKSPPRKEARGRGQDRYRYYQDRRSSSSSSVHPAATSTTSPGKDTIPSASQFKSLMSSASKSFDTSTDVRLKTPGHGLQEKIIPATNTLHPPTPIGPAQPGDSCLDAKGNIDWIRAPRRPEGLPVDFHFKVDAVDGVWKVSITQ